VSGSVLPALFSRITTINLVVPVVDQPDITDRTTRRVVIPAVVELHLHRQEGTDEGTRQWGFVSVTGARRLKSGAVGDQISTVGWSKAHGRPDWLTDVITTLLPDGWDPALLDLPAGGVG
jgi:hypothetical protein